MGQFSVDEGTLVAVPKYDLERLEEARKRLLAMLGKDTKYDNILVACSMGVTDVMYEIGQQKYPELEGPISTVEPEWLDVFGWLEKFAEHERLCPGCGSHAVKFTLHDPEHSGIDYSVTCNNCGLHTRGLNVDLPVVMRMWHKSTTVDDDQKIKGWLAKGGKP